MFTSAYFDINRFKVELSLKIDKIRDLLVHNIKTIYIFWCLEEEKESLYMKIDTSAFKKIQQPDLDLFLLVPFFILLPFSKHFIQLCVWDLFYFVLKSFHKKLLLIESFLGTFRRWICWSISPKLHIKYNKKCMIQEWKLFLMVWVFFFLFYFENSAGFFDSLKLDCKYLWPWQQAWHY